MGMGTFSLRGPRSRGEIQKWWYVGHCGRSGCKSVWGKGSHPHFVGGGLKHIDALRNNARDRALKIDKQGKTFVRNCSLIVLLFVD